MYGTDYFARVKRAIGRIKKTTRICCTGELAHMGGSGQWSADGDYFAPFARAAQDKQAKRTDKRRRGRRDRKII